MELGVFLYRLPQPPCFPSLELWHWRSSRWAIRKKSNLFTEGWRSEQLFNYRSPTAYYLHRFICLTRNEVCVVQERLIGVITTKQRNLKSENLLWNDWLGRKLFWEQRAWHSQKSERVQYRKVCVHNFSSNICLLILTPLYLLLFMYVMNVS